MNYYIADTHFGHDAILRFSNRPFENIKEMNEAIITNWNAKVSETDTVYILGDFSYKGGDPTKYLKRLPGNKILVRGNHDGKLISAPNLKDYVSEVCDLKTVVDGGRRVVLCHYPMVEWDGYYNGALHFYGHVHNTFHNDTTKYASGMKNAYNVGVDIIGFEPRTLLEIINGGVVL